MEMEQTRTRLLNWMKFLYVLSGLMSGAWVRFSTLFFDDQEFNSFQIGILQAVVPFLGVLAQLVWGYLSDHACGKRPVFLITAIVKLITLLSFLVSWWGTHSFLGFLVRQLLLACFSAPGLLMDYLLHLLQMTFSSDKQQTSRFGSIRVFMTLPYGIGTVLMSFSAQWIGVSWNLVMYCGMAAFYLLVVSVFLPSKREEEEDENDEFQEWPTNTWERLLINPSEPSLSVTFCQWIYPHVPFLFNLLLFGILLFGVVENLLFLFIVHDLEGNDILCGVTVLVTVLFEIPIFIHSGWFLTHLDYHGCLAAAYLCYALRVGAYTLLTPATRWWILVPELLHGFMFALSYTVVVEYGNLHKGKWGVLVMGTITSVFQSLGPGIGSLVGGYAMETYGAKSLYLVCSVIAFLLGISHVAKRLCQSTRVFPESQ